MQENIFPAAEKILYDIENVLKKDQNLIGFEIIPALDHQNKSPVLHAENSLGLASWSVKPLYRYVHSRLLELRQNRSKREDPSVISRWLLGALLLNPDVSTFWNMRRELVKSGRLEPKSELQFVGIVLYYKAKCFEGFAYRRWLLKLILMGDTQPANVESLLTNEVNIATMSADRYANNYHAWDHREYIVATLRCSAPSNFSTFLETEWDNSGKWCSLHVSDYSGFAYRQFLLKMLLSRDEDTETLARTETKARDILAKFFIHSEISVRNSEDFEAYSPAASCEWIVNYLHATPDLPVRQAVHYLCILVHVSYWAEECLFNEELIDIYPGHEALWYHRRALAHVLFTLTASYQYFYQYKADLIDEKSRCGNVRVNSRVEVLSRNALINVFKKRNDKLIAKAYDIGGHERVMGERFQKFLTNYDDLNVRKIYTANNDSNKKVNF